jgi:hypothetical protein
MGKAVAIFLKVTLAILVFLALSSGVTKMMLMRQDAEFFGAYGFTTPILLAFGAAQFIGGLLLIFQRTRFLGAVIVAITFLISAVLLVMDENVPFTIFTFVAVLFLGLHMKLSLAKHQGGT